jgi:phage terminase small subunit
MTDKDTNKGKPYLKVVRDTDRLTAKQESFAQKVAAGSILSDAYRESYSAENMADKTVWSEACRLAQNHKVATRIKAIQADIEADHRTRAARREEYVLKKLQDEAEHAETDGSRVRALELLGKTVGLFTDKVEIEQDTDKSAAELEQELERRLAGLLGRGE